MTNPTTRLLLAASFVAIAALPIQAQSRPDVLILGDSQISFGAGGVYQDFFKKLRRNCRGSNLGKPQLKQLGKRQVLAVGVRSSSLHSWVARSGSAKDTICEVDKKFGVNAGVYGINGEAGRKFIQIGKKQGFEYCRSGQPALKTALHKAGSHPELLILNFLGNSEQRWASSQANANRDVKRALRYIPKDLPCIVLTTAPVFSKATNDARMIAQDNLAKAMGKFGGHCTLVKGYSTETRQAIEGKPRFFKRNEAGKIVDPHHPAPAAIRDYLRITAPRLCNAIDAVLK